MDDKKLDHSFAVLKIQQSEPSEGLIARILADAAHVQTKHPSSVAASQRAEPFWASLGQLFRGWPALAGMAATVAAGVWLGFHPPYVMDGYILENATENTADYVIDLASGENEIFSEEVL